MEKVTKFWSIDGYLFDTEEQMDAHNREYLAKLSQPKDD
jgi:hypothetical protein